MRVKVDETDGGQFVKKLVKPTRVGDVVGLHGLRQAAVVASELQETRVIFFNLPNVGIA